MSVQAINPTLEPGEIPANSNTSIPLSQRIGALQAANDTPSIIPIEDPNLGDLYAWLMEFIDMVNAPNITLVDRTNKFGSKKELSDMLMSKLKSYRTEDDKSVYNGISKMLTVLSSLQDKFVAHGVPEMADFLNGERTRLTGINMFMVPWIQRALFPTIENGGKPMPWDPDDDPFDNSRSL
jgi:hypothetical protein